jgi:hypothetical protein
MPNAEPGVRIEVVSLEPIILLSVTRKARDVESITVMQPFYAPAWNEDNASKNMGVSRPISIKSTAKRFFGGRGRLVNLIRNSFLVIGLIFGSSPYSLNNPRFKKLKVDQVMRRVA